MRKLKLEVRRWLAVVATLVLLTSTAGALPQPGTGGKDGGPIDLLMLKGNIEIGFGNAIDLDKTLVEKLHALGYRITVIEDFQPLTLDYLKQFNTVVWIGPSPISGGPYFNPASWRGGVHTLTAAGNAKVIEEYVKEGGGLLLTPVIEEAGMSRIESLKELMAPYGLNPECAGIRDDNNKFLLTLRIGQFPMNLCWTEAIARHPATEGVKRIYYPDYMMRWDDNYTTIPVFPTDKAWTVLAKGMPGSWAGWKQGTVFELGFWAKAKGWEEPPFVLARDFGKGRVAVISICHFNLFYFPYSKKGNYWENSFGSQDGRMMELGNVPLPRKVKGKMVQPEPDGPVVPSDMLKLTDNLYRWLSEPGAKVGLGGYDAEKGIKAPPIPKPSVANVSEVWADKDPMCTGKVRPMKVLVGARTSYSDGKGSVAEYADAARKAGYDLICFTETFEHLTDDKYRKLVADCEQLTDEGIAFLPGIDVADRYGNRFLIVGLRRPLRPHQLMKDGKSAPSKTLYWTGYMLLGMGDVLPIAARPGRLATARGENGALPPDIYQHLTGVAVATYDAAGKQVDDGMFAYEWQAFNASIPAPIAVHEVYSPAEVATAAGAGLQNYVNSDTPAHTACYFRQGIESYGGNPLRYYISSAPLVDAAGIDNWSSPHWQMRIKAHGPNPITDVIVRDQRRVHRHLKTNAKEIDAKCNGDLGAHQWFLVELRDAAGGKAFLSPIRNLPRRNFTRCMDRQNWFGLGRRSFYAGRSSNALGLCVSSSVPGVKAPGRTSTMAQFTYISDDVVIFDYNLGYTYLRSGGPFGIDSAPMFNVQPIPEYSAWSRVVWHPYPDKPMVVENSITLKQDLKTQGPVWPVLAKTKGADYVYNDGSGKKVAGKVAKDEFIDLPVGAKAGSVVLLTPMRLTGEGQLGPANQEPGAVAKAGTTYKGEFIVGQLNRKLMGFDGPTDFKIDMKQGKLERVALRAIFQTEDYGVAGTLTAGKSPTPSNAVRVLCKGANPNWPLIRWTPAEKGEKERLRQFGYVDGTMPMGRMWTRLGGPFYFGNALIASDPNLRLAFASKWTRLDDEEKTPVVIEAHNPTDKPITATVRTPKAVADRVQISEKVTVPAGSSVYITAQ